MQTRHSQRHVQANQRNGSGLAQLARTHLPSLVVRIALSHSEWMGYYTHYKGRVLCSSQALNKLGPMSDLTKPQHA